MGALLIFLQKCAFLFCFQVAKSLNVLWLLSASSLEDPFCLMEVCAAVRQGVPVIPIRLAGKGMRPLEAPIWPSIKMLTPAAPEQDHHSMSLAENSDGSVHHGDGHSVSLAESSDGGDNHAGGGTDVAGVDGREAGSQGDGGSTGGSRLLSSSTTVTRGGDIDGTSQRGRPRLDRHASDAFYAQLAQRLPRSAQAELHRNRFLVRDVFAAVRACFESVEGAAEIGAKGGAVGGGVWAAAESLRKSTSRQPASNHTEEPAIFNLSGAHASHSKVLGELVGSGSSRAGKEDRDARRAPWNWERLPESAAQAGRVRGSKAVPWRTEEEVSEIIREEGAEADDLAGEG